MGGEKTGRVVSFAAPAALLVMIVLAALLVPQSKAATAAPGSTDIAMFRATLDGAAMAPAVTTAAHADATFVLSAPLTVHYRIRAFGMGGIETVGLFAGTAGTN